MGFWHYSPNGCCVYTNNKTGTIHHLYLKETCSLTRNGRTVQQLLSPRSCADTYNHNDNDNDDDVDGSGGGDYDSRFLKVVLQPYLNNITTINAIDQRILINMNYANRQKLLDYNDEIMSQFWFIECDLSIEFDISPHTNTESFIQHLILKNCFGPLVYCISIEAFSLFFSSVTSRFIHDQMTVLNSLSTDILLHKLMENVKFIEKFPAQRMIQYHPTNSLVYMDARDLFDVVRLGQSNNLTNMRYVHITNEANFLDTWRRILFNFVHELTYIHSFEKQSIRIKSSCDSVHFLKGNNKTVIPEFRCDSDREDNCIHLKARRKEYEMTNSRLNCNTVDREKYTIALSDEGVICRFVLKVMTEEYGAAAVDEKLNFNCYFNTVIFDHPSASVWERVINQTLGIDRKLMVRDGNSAQARERIACMQTLCNERRMNDIHRFCLPKRFLTLAWFKWACKELKINIFDQD